MMTNQINNKQMELIYSYNECNGIKNHQFYD